MRALFDESTRALDAGVVDAMQASLRTRVPESAAGPYVVERLGSDEISRLAASSSDPARAAVVSSQPAGQNREWRLFVGTNTTSNGDQPSDYCPKADTVALVSCSSVTTDDGIETTETYVGMKATEVSQRGQYVAVDSATVTETMLPNLRVQRIVRLHLPGGGRISAWETVYGAPSKAFDAAFKDAAGLVDAVHDQALLKALTK